MACGASSVRERAQYYEVGEADDPKKAKAADNLGDKPSNMLPMSGPKYLAGNQICRPQLELQNRLARAFKCGLEFRAYLLTASAKSADSAQSAGSTAGPAPSAAGSPGTCSSVNFVGESKVSHRHGRDRRTEPRSLESRAQREKSGPRTHYRPPRIHPRA